MLHFFPLFLIPPVANGPFPFALSAISALAFASGRVVSSLLLLVEVRGSHTSLLLRFECDLVFIHFLLFLLGSLQRLCFAACNA